MLKIRIETNNATFDDGRREEIKKCLEDVIHRINYFEREGSILDSKGNNVGSFKLTNR